MWKGEEGEGRGKAPSPKQTDVGEMGGAPCMI